MMGSNPLPTITCRWDTVNQKYAKALEVQKKAYEIIKTLYPHNKAQLGTNYLLMTLNTSIAYYQNSNNAEALKFSKEAENIANELKELNQLFSSTSCCPVCQRRPSGQIIPARLRGIIKNWSGV